MGRDKRERRRIERAHKKAQVVRHAARKVEAVAHRMRAATAALEAKRKLRSGVATEALGAAAPAAALAPNDTAIAALYVRAAELVGDPRRLVRACEHLRRLIKPDPAL